MRFHRSLLTLFLSLASGACLAHTGAHPVEGFAAGLIHPLAGSDHVLAMLAVGLWAAVLPGADWRLPVVFMALMVAGGVAGATGLSLGGSEAGIAISVLSFGLLVAGKSRPAFPLAAAVTGLFALFHGFAHGAEMAAGSRFAAYALGFVTATGVLHLAGILMGRALLQMPAVYRTLGGAMAVWGAQLLLESL